MRPIDAPVVLDLLHRGSMRLLYLTSSDVGVDALVVLDLYRWACCTWPLSMYLLVELLVVHSTLVVPKWAVEPDLLTLVNEQETL